MRKKDHIDLAFKSRVLANDLDERFNYEPLLNAHPQNHEFPVSFLGKSLRLPLWVSSMTGGTDLGRTINHNLARVCHDFGMGMGLGSCRALLYSDETLADFDVRSIIGPDLPLFGNIGIAQVEQLIAEQAIDRLERLVDRLQLDGMIIHVNPLQEAFQSEGDSFSNRPIDVISLLVAECNISLIVKEVGQGMGPQSLRALFQLPLAAIDFGASGGTNFALLEILRKASLADHLEPLTKVGHSAASMAQMVNLLIDDLDHKVKCREVIVSGGIKDFLDGYYLIKKLSINSVYGQASAFLKYAMGDYEPLFDYVSCQAKGLALANAYLTLK